MTVGSDDEFEDITCGEKERDEYGSTENDTNSSDFQLPSTSNIPPTPSPSPTLGPVSMSTVTATHAPSPTPASTSALAATHAPSPTAASTSTLSATHAPSPTPGPASTRTPTCRMLFNVDNVTAPGWTCLVQCQWQCTRSTWAEWTGMTSSANYTVRKKCRKFILVPLRGFTHQLICSLQQLLQLVTTTATETVSTPACQESHESHW